MPQRKNVVRVDCTAVMGEESYVLVRQITTAEAREVLELSKQRNTEIREKATELRMPKELKPIYLQELQADSAQKSLEDALSRYADHILEWNWVFEDGTTMPLPSKDRAVLETLTGEELRLLARALGMLSSEDARDFA